MQLIPFAITPNNVADNNHSLMWSLTQNLFAKYIEDKDLLKKNN